MIMTLPDTPALRAFSVDDLRLELACALFQHGRLGKIAASELAEVDLFSFQQALYERGIPAADEASLDQDIAALDRLFTK
ncbi:UPF0175 family protein [Prosthecobacter sp. SYSU 5D2]|uniref:UPF0175 family protein n=1 Tax=Prosthecobacter sp. SYSU 5D2 TaxID=3134134 RepID=UPI0031FEC400